MPAAVHFLIVIYILAFIIFKLNMAFQGTCKDCLSLASTSDLALALALALVVVLSLSFFCLLLPPLSTTHDPILKVSNSLHCGAVGEVPEASVVALAKLCEGLRKSTLHNLSE